MVLEATTNQYGIRTKDAENFDLGFDVVFAVDYTERAVADELKKQYGEKPPVGLKPRVSVNAKTAARLARRATPSEPSADQ